MSCLYKPYTWVLPGIAFLVIGSCVGCTEPMALNTSMASLDTRTKSIAIFTLTVRNDFKPDYKLAPFYASVESGQAGTTRFMLAGDWNGHGDPNAGLIWSGQGEGDFPVSLSLAPGKCELARAQGAGSAGIFIYSFDFPLNAEFELPPGSVVYLGHIVMTNREAKRGEPPSGDWHPIIDQAVSGMAAGTMDISITDQSSVDIPKFLAKYPCLKGVTIKTAIMTKR